MSLSTNEHHHSARFQLLLLLWLVMVSGGPAAVNGKIVSVTLDGCHRIRGQTQQSLYDNRTFASFKGVPFAEAPVGLLRFKPPVAKTLPDSLDAFTYGSVCLQPGYEQPRYGGEDCLFLNVFTPSTRPFVHSVFRTRPLAVMVFIPGGGYTEGGIDDFFYGPDFLVEKDIVLVTINYRLNAFGFMSLGNEQGYSGNMGLQDQQLALRWVQRHIAQFGGDPRKVTVFGESAGGSSVHLQMLAASSRGLFQRAILQSGTACNFWAISWKGDHRQQMMDLAKQHNSSVHSFADLVDWLQRAPASLLLDHFNVKPNSEIVDVGYDLPWAPTPSGSADQTFGHFEDNYESGLDVLLGYNSAEMLGAIGPINGNASKFQHLDQNFEVYLPFPTWKKCRNATAYNEVMSATRRFYFGDAKIDNATFTQLIAMLSDIQFTYGVDQAVQHQIANSRGRTYYYRISANTTLNIFKRLTNTTALRGTSHGDELCYIFKCLIYPNIYDNLLPESTERTVQKHLLNLWTDFAKFGNPTPRGVPLDFAPTTEDNHRLVDIGNDGLTKVDNPNSHVNSFWDKIFEEHSNHFLATC